MRVLSDTNVISYWLADDARFRAGISKALAEFGNARSFFVSTVTTQELMVWARLSGTPESTYAFLAAHFAPLDFTQACALDAARLLSVVGRPADARKGTKKERRTTIEHWQRDAAIAATASHHALDVIFTANEKDFAAFRNHLPCKIVAPVAIDA